MRRLFGWMAGLAGIAALARVLSARQARRSASPPLLERPQDPADALREKLAETRSGGSEADPSREPVTAAGEGGETIDERRARIHAKAQETIESMQEDPS